MRKSGFVRASILVIILLIPVVWLLWSFPPYEICVRYYAKEASSSMGPDALGYAENLCARKIRFWQE